MTGKLKLYIGLMVLGLLVIGGGIWMLVKYPPEIDIPEGNPVIYERLDYVMRGEFSYLYFYEYGSIIYIEEKGLRIRSPLGGGDIHTPIPVKDMGILWAYEPAPDDIMPVSGGGPAYRANVHQQGVENPWPPIEVTDVYLGSSSDEAHIYYRNHIETKTRETRNNVIKVTDYDIR